MKSFNFKVKPKFIPEYDEGYRPFILDNMVYEKALKSEDKEPVKISILRENGLTSLQETSVFKNSHYDDNIVYIERLVKTLLWLKGGYKVFFGGPAYIGEYLQSIYSKGKEREFDADTMKRIYGQDFEIQIVSLGDVPKEYEEAKAVGGHVGGCRIGFDAGSSDKKVSSVINGKSIYSEEVVWHPKLSEDSSYQYEGILSSLKTAASKLPKVDAIGISAAGIYINNEIKLSSLFIKIPDDEFENKVKRMFFDIAKEMGNIPFEVANDGDVTALAGAMSLNQGNILGIAMGTSEAAGYVDNNGCLKGWLNELAFVPIDYNEKAMQDEWSGDIGCGVKYFSQDGVIKLAQKAKIELEVGLSPAEKLKVVQALLEANDKRAQKIFEDIGCYFGYALAYYAKFYDIEYVLLLGRVSSGRGGELIVEKAKEIIKEEFPEFDKKMTISLPDEKSRRVGQSVAAASLTKI
jgi:predicted NBD/HSP70 family sugar kinase